MSCIDCPICFESIKPHSRVREKLSCGHSFHRKCISEWFARDQNDSCPVCRNVEKKT